MIKVAITGADTPEAGELIRILTGHPDVDLIAARAPGHEGIALASHHHGLIGETALAFTSSLPIQKTNVLIACGPTPPPAELRKLLDTYPNLKVIAFDPIPGLPDEEYVYGLPELNRKPMVRGARLVVLPSHFASLALVALLPLAANLLLSGDIVLNFTAPPDIIAETDLVSVAAEIETQLRNIQNSYDGHVSIVASSSSSRRTAMMTTDLKCSVTLPHIMQIYEVYDDHNFAFPVAHKVGVSEVAGTNKCVVSLEKSDAETLHLSAAADCRLRGGAGEAVHVLNLLCGLHEKTGLALKAIDFSPIQVILCQ